MTWIRPIGVGDIESSHDAQADGQTMSDQEHAFELGSNLANRLSDRSAGIDLAEEIPWRKVVSVSVRISQLKV